MAKNQFLKWQKINLKLPEMQFHKFFGNIWFHEFYCLDFYKFSGPLYLHLFPENEIQNSNEDRTSN